MRSRIPFMSAVSSNTMTAPEPSVAPMARVPSKVSGTSSCAAVTNEPAAPPSRTACIVCPGSSPDLDVNPQHASGARLRDRTLDALSRQRVFRPHVEEAFLTPGCERGHRHALDDGERIVLHQLAIFEGARL